MTDTKPAPKGIRIGAKVTVVGTVVNRPFIDGHPVRLQSGDIHWFGPEDFLTVENPPEELRVGDRVRSRYQTNNVGRIFGIDDQQCAVRWDDGACTTPFNANLERLPS